MNIYLCGRHVPSPIMLYGHSTLDADDTSTKVSSITFNYTDYDGRSASETVTIAKGASGSFAPVSQSMEFMYEYAPAAKGSPSTIAVNFTGSYFSSDSVGVTGHFSDLFTVDNDGKVKHTYNVFPGQVYISNSTTVWMPFDLSDADYAPLGVAPMWAIGEDGLPAMLDMSDSFSDILGDNWDDWDRNDWGYPKNYGVWKMDANNDGYPWLWGFDEIPPVNADIVYIKQNDSTLKNYYVHIKNTNGDFVEAQVYIKTASGLVRVGR